MNIQRKRKPPPGSSFIRCLAQLYYFHLASYHFIVHQMPKEMLHFSFKVGNVTAKSGETVVLTGATGEIGFAVLKRLLQSGFKVFIGVESVEDWVKSIKEIRERFGISTETVICLHLDLKSFKSVQNFARMVLLTAERLDVLINCAEIGNIPFEVTEDNVEATFQVNYLSHLLLTQLLLPKMRETGAGQKSPCRIVNVSSFLHYLASGKNLKYSAYPKVYSGAKAYCESKLCQVLSATYLNKVLEEENANVRVYSVHAGIIATSGVWSHWGLIGKAVKAFKGLFRTVDEGANEILFVALSPFLQNKGGSYVQNTSVQNPLKDAEKEELQKLLWDKSQEKIKEFVS